MEMKELVKFIEEEDARLARHYGSNLDKEKTILARTVKLAEELGELCNEVLSHTSLQRRDKLDSHDKDHIKEEFAAVIEDFSRRKRRFGE